MSEARPCSSAVKNRGGGASGIRALPLGGAAWFGGAADAAMRVEVVDPTNGVTYLTAAAGEREVVWRPSASGQYRLTLQKRDGEAWTA